MADNVGLVVLSGCGGGFGRYYTMPGVTACDNTLLQHVHRFPQLSAPDWIALLF